MQYYYYEEINYTFKFAIMFFLFQYNSLDSSTKRKSNEEPQKKLSNGDFGRLTKSVQLS